MLKRLAVLCLVLFVPLGACAPKDLQLGEGVTQAKADLHFAEQKFARAQAAIISLAKAKVLKGETLAAVKKAEDACYQAIVVARVAVDAGRADAATVVSTVLVKVLELVALYTGEV